MPGAHGAGAEGSAFLGHLLSALGQLGVGAPAGGKKKLIWNMEKKKKATGGNQNKTAPMEFRKPRRIPVVLFFFFLISVKISPPLAISATAIPRPL